MASSRHSWGRFHKSISRLLSKANACKQQVFAIHALNTIYKANEKLKYNLQAQISYTTNTSHSIVNSLRCFMTNLSPRVQNNEPERYSTALLPPQHYHWYAAHSPLPWSSYIHAFSCALERWSAWGGVYEGRREGSAEERWKTMSWCINVII